MYDLSELKFQFFIIGCLTMFAFYLSGRLISNSSSRKVLNNQSYWRAAIPIIVMYGIFMGLRFGRMIDYNIYYVHYEEIVKNINDKRGVEPLFALLMHAFGLLNLKYYHFILFTSLLTICSFLTYVRKKQDIVFLAVILFLSETFMAENLIKWYVAFSFFLYALHYYQEHKIKKAALFIVISVCFHIGMLFAVIPFILLMCVKKNLPSKICFILFIISSFVGSVNFLNILSPLMPYMGINEKLALYALQYNDIITGKFGIMGMNDQKNWFEIIRNIIAFGVPILIAPKLLKKRKFTTYELNAFYIGTILQPIFIQVEILGRISGVFHFFQIIICSYVYVYVLRNKNEISPYLYHFMLLGLIFIVWPSIRLCMGVGRNEWNQLLFIWDVNGLLK